MRAYAVIAAWLVAGSIVSATVADVLARESASLSPKEVRKRARKLPADLVHEVAAMQYVLRPDELADLLSDTDPQRCRAWIDAWWDARDPIPTNATNEARDVHEERVLAAQAEFGRGAWPGWDDRGEVLIRYGAPAVRTAVDADVVPPGIFIPAEELWYYPQFDIYARFADTGYNGYAQFQESVDTPVAERSRSDRRNLASEYNPDIPMDYMPVDMEHVDAMNLYAPTSGWGYDNFLERVHGYYDLEDRVPAAYPFDFAPMHIPAFVSVQSFRGGDGVDRVDVNTEFQSARRSLPLHSGERRFVTTSVFWSHDGKELARSARVDSLPADPPRADSALTVVNQLTMTLPPGTYRMAVTVEEEGSGRFATARREVACHDMDDGIAMSDIALARSIEPSRDGSPFNRGALEVVPRPSAQYRSGRPVPVYFEVYHVGANADGTRAYTVEYTIKPVAERRRGLWARLLGRHDAPVQIRSGFDAVAPGPYDAVRIFASTQNLAPGEFVLEVAVTDGVSSKRVVRNATFRVLKQK